MDRKTLLGIGAVVLLLCFVTLCVVGIGGYIYRDQVLALLGLAPAQQVANMLPAETDFYLSVTPNIQNVPGYQNLKSLYLDNPDIQVLLDEFEKEISNEAGITYEADIKPWLGPELVIAAPDFNQDIQAQLNFDTAPPAFVIASQTINKEASDQFIAKVLAEAAEDQKPFTDQLYQDVTLHLQHNQDSNENFVLATFNNFVVLSSSESLVKGMIDKSKGNETPSLADSAGFKKITGELPANAVMTFYMEGAGILEAALADSAIELPANTVQDIEAFEGMGMAGTLQPDGIQLDVVASYNVEKMSEAMQASLKRPASPNAILTEIPAEALFVMNGYNLKLIWDSVKQSLEANPDFSQQMQDLEQELGFSVEEDIFSWMTGEYALVLLETTPLDEFSFPMGGYSLIGASDVNQARSHVEKIAGILAEGEGLPLESQTVQGIEMTGLPGPEGQFLGGYGFYKDYFLVAFQEDAVKALSSAGQNSLSNSANFKAVQSHLPASNYGYFYADLDQLQRLAEGQLSDFEREDYEANVRPFIEPVHALGVAASNVGVEQGLSKGILFILISEPLAQK
jgi:hypothetical protein